jgi:hypothetical protein
MSERSQVHLLLLIVGMLTLLGGCMGSPAETTPGTDSVSETEGSAGSATATPPLMPDSDPIQTYMIGDNSTMPRNGTHHSYRIANSQFPSESDLHMTVIIRQNSSSVFQRNVTIPPRKHISIDNYVVGDYTIEVQPEEHPHRTFTSPLGKWDCNSAWFDMLLRPNGSWSTEWFRTMELCPTVTPDTSSTDMN